MIENWNHRAHCSMNSLGGLIVASPGEHWHADLPDIQTVPTGVEGLLAAFCVRITHGDICQPNQCSWSASKLFESISQCLGEAMKPTISQQVTWANCCSGKSNVYAAFLSHCRIHMFVVSFMVEKDPFGHHFGTSSVLHQSPSIALVFWNDSFYSQMFKVQTCPP